MVLSFKNPDITINELMEDIQGPDFPTAGLILGKSGIRRAYETGRFYPNAFTQRLKNAVVDVNVS